MTIDNDGLSSYRLYREGIADKHTSFEEIQANLPYNLKESHTGSLAITLCQLPRIHKLFALMHEQGVVVSLDINIRLRANIDTRAYLDGVRSLLPLADIVKASDEGLEPFQFDSHSGEAAVRADEEMKSGMLVLTRVTAVPSCILTWARLKRGHIQLPRSKIRSVQGISSILHFSLRCAAPMRSRVRIGISMPVYLAMPSTSRVPRPP